MSSIIEYLIFIII